MSLGRDRIISLGSKLPPALGTFGRLRALLDDADCDVEETSELLQMDPALTFQIIRLSNRALSGLGALSFADEATAMLLDHWRFPLEIAGAICTHTTPARAAEFTAGAATLHLAAAIATDWGCALPGEAGLWRRDPAMCALAGVAEEMFEGAATDARKQFGRFAALEWSQAA